MPLTVIPTHIHVNLLFYIFCFHFKYTDMCTGYSKLKVKIMCDLPLNLTSILNVREVKVVQESLEVEPTIRLEINNTLITP